MLPYIIIGGIILLAVVFFIWRRRLQAAAYETQALVLLLSKPRALDEAEVRATVCAALGLSIDPEDDDATYFVVPFTIPELMERSFGVEGTAYLLKIPDGIFILNAIPAPYWQPEALAHGPFRDERLNHIARTHAAWISMDLMQLFEEGGSVEAAYRAIGKVLAAYIDDRVLGIYSTERHRMNPITPESRAVLTGDDPLSVVETAPYVPMIAISGDDPRMAAAIAEARAAWPTFVTAYTTPTRAQHDFVVKVRFTNGENAEYIWVMVTGLEGETITGTLGNEPAYLTDLHDGDVVTFPRDDVIDWIFFEGEEMRGNYTMPVLLEASKQHATQLKS